MQISNLFAVALVAVACLSHRADTAAPATLSEITGRVQAPSVASTVVFLYTSTGQKRVTHLHSDATFKFTGVPAGSHLIQAFHPSSYFPEVVVDVGKSGVYRAQIIAQIPQPPGTATQATQVPLLLRPLGDMVYFEKRKPVDVWSFFKSPYGIMIGFSLFIIVVMPRLKVDPEEMKALQAELKGEKKETGQGTSTGGSAQQRIAAR